MEQSVAQVFDNVRGDDEIEAVRYDSSKSLGSIFFTGVKSDVRK